MPIANPDLSTQQGQLKVSLATFSNLADKLDTRALGIRDLITHLSDRWAISLIGCSCGLEDGLRKHLVRYCPLDMKGYEDVWPNRPNRALRLLKVVRQISNYAGQSDILYFDTTMYAAYARRPGRPIPGLAMEVHGILAEEGRATGELHSISMALFRLVERCAFRLADRLIAVSNSLKEYLVSECRVSSDRIRVIQNAVDMTFLTRKASGEDIRSRYGWGNIPIVFFHGSFKRWHGVDRLVEAWPYVVAEVPQARLVLVGDGPGREMVERLCRQTGVESTVALVGNQPRLSIPDFLAAADICVYFPDYNVPPYGFLGNPLKIVEYMSAGKPIVTLDIPGLSEQIRMYNCGLLTTPSPEAFADGIIRLLKQPELALQLGQNGRQAVIKERTWPYRAQQINEVCVDLVHQRRQQGLEGVHPKSCTDLACVYCDTLDQPDAALTTT